MHEATIVALYCDGGLVGPVNPSPDGGTWAWCAVNPFGARIAQASGVIDAPRGGTVSNNVAEFVAAVLALETVPAGWSGTLYSDSLITLNRLFQGWTLTNIPPDWVQRGSAALQRLGNANWVLLQGHPTKAELQAGRGKKGYPVSEHNVWCDQACRAAALAERSHRALLGVA
jgi:ribonuclease HI